MGYSGKEVYSHFGFYNALPADLYSAATAGRTIDIRGYEAVAFIVNAHSVASAGAMSADNRWRLVLQHGLASAAGVSAWSNVPGSRLIHSVVGGYDSTAETGVFQSIASSTDAVSTILYFVGYKPDKDHRYIRLYLSNTGAASTMWAGAVCVLGSPSNWPVNEPV